MLPSNNVTQRRTISLIAISHVIPDEQPVRFRSQVGVLTTAYRRGPEVRFGEVTWTYSRLCAEVPAGVNSRDTGLWEVKSNPQGAGCSVSRKPPRSSAAVRRCACGC